MSAEDIHSLDETIFESSIKKRDFSKICNQQGANLNDSDENSDYFFEDNRNYYQIEDAHLQFELSLKRKGVVVILKTIKQKPSDW